MHVDARARPWYAVLVWSCLSACAGGGEDEGGALLAFCNFDDECAGAICLLEHDLVEGARYCSQACSAEAPCPSIDGVQLVCAGVSQGRAACARPCTAGRTWHSPGLPEPHERVCLEGTPTYCSDLSAEEASRSCAMCGCADGEHCAVDGCQPQRAKGEPCEDHEACQSDNCGKPSSDTSGASRCMVALGEACTIDDCQTCWLYDGARCTRGCADDIDCPSGWLCIGSETATGFVGLCKEQCPIGVPIGGPVPTCPEGARCMQQGNVAWCDTN